MAEAALAHLLNGDDAFAIFPTIRPMPQNEQPTLHLQPVADHGNEQPMFSSQFGHRIHSFKIKFQ